MVGLVHDHQVPSRCLLELCRAIPTPHQVAGADNERLLVPLVAGDCFLSRPLKALGFLPDKFVPVVDRHVEVELLVEFVLPLLHHRLGHKQKHTLGQPGNPRLPYDEPRRDRLPEADLIGNEHLARPRVDQSLERPQLVRPWVDGARHLADPQTVG